VAAAGQDVIAVVDLAYRAACEQVVAKLDTSAPGEMVIAGACFGELERGAVLAERANRRRRRDLRERLKRGGNLRAGQLVVAVPALGADLHQAALYQAAQVRRRGCRPDPGAAGKLPGRQCHTGGQRIEHRRPRGIPDKHRDGREVAITALLACRVVAHDTSVPQARFGAGQNVLAAP
jgi:hypothetical protein